MGLVQQCARPMVVHNEIIEKELEAVEGTQYVTKESILRRAQEIKGIPLRDVDKTGRLATGKGAIGSWRRTESYALSAWEKRDSCQGTAGLQYHQLYGGVR